jgi:PPM family protein phosphatase
VSFDVATLSRTGGRAANEDYGDFLQLDGSSCWVIADGLGGHQGGATASKTVVEAALQSFRERPDVSVDAVASHVAHAQAALLEAQRLEPRLSQMRSTLVVLICSSDTAVWAHVGDSRLYHLRGGRVVDRTRDHSVGQALVDGGQIDVAAQGSHEDRSRLLRCLGKEEEAAATVSGPHALARGDVFLLCTDGFWEAIDDLALGLDLAASEDAALWLDRLEARLRRSIGPSHDNYSATAVRVLSAAAFAPPPHDPRAPIHQHHDHQHHDDERIGKAAGVEHLVAAAASTSPSRRPHLGMQGIAIAGLIAVVLLAAGVRYRDGIAAWMRALVSPAAAERPGTGSLPSVPKTPSPEPKPEAAGAVPDAKPPDAGPKVEKSKDEEAKDEESQDAKSQDAKSKDDKSKGEKSQDAKSKDADIGKPASDPRRPRDQAPLNEGRPRKPSPEIPR